MQKKYIPAVVIVILALVGAVSVIVISQRSSNSTEDSDVSACQNAGQTHTLTIKDDRFDTNNLDIQRCDKVKIVNTDKASRLIALGTHDHHITYPGFDETSLGGGDTFTFTAFKAGKYIIHDHIDDAIEATITIK